MKIYWKILIWNCTVLPWLKLIHCRKSLHWKNTNGIYWNWMWTPERRAKCEKGMASLVKGLDDVIRKVTAEDDAIKTIVSTETEKKAYKGGKVVVIKKVT